MRPWTDIGNPIKRREFPFPESLRKDCDQYYVDNYIRWYVDVAIAQSLEPVLILCYRYGTEPFASANGQIPQVNLWDDHDVSGP